MKKHLENFILRHRGGGHYWTMLAAVVETMTEQQAEAFLQLLQNVERDAKTEGGNSALRKLGLPKGIVG